MQNSSYMNTRHTSTRSANARCVKFLLDKDGYMSVGDYAPPSLIKMRTVFYIRRARGPRVADGSSCHGGYLSNRPRLSACI